MARRFPFSLLDRFAFYWPKNAVTWQMKKEWTKWLIFYHMSVKNQTLCGEYNLESSQIRPLITVPCQDTSKIPNRGKQPQKKNHHVRKYLRSQLSRQGYYPKKPRSTEMGTPATWMYASLMWKPSSVSCSFHIKLTYIQVTHLSRSSSRGQIFKTWHTEIPTK